jgi:micrococcal nuclease
MKHQFLKKAGLLACSFVTAATLTACSFSFSGGEELSNAIEKGSETVIKVINDVSEAVDNTDFKDEDSLSDLTDRVSDYANELAKETDSEFEKASLVRVVDGDTIVVEIEDEQYKVRLIGVDTPESVASEEYLERTGKENTAEGKTASEFTESVLSDYEYVYLQSDTSDTDRYGRLLRYVWLEIPEDEYDLSEISTKMLNGILVAQGYANVATYKPDTMHEQDFEELAEERE